VGKADKKESESCFTQSLGEEKTELGFFNACSICRTNTELTKDRNPRTKGKAFCFVSFFIVFWRKGSKSKNAQLSILKSW